MLGLRRVRRCSRGMDRSMDGARVEARRSRVLMPERQQKETVWRLGSACLIVVLGFEEGDNEDWSWNMKKTSSTLLYPWQLVG